MTTLDYITLTHYSTPGAMTDLADVPARVFEGLPEEPRVLCRSVQGLIVHEVGHNYVMGLLANNEWREGWLDEGFTTFQSTWFWEVMGRPTTGLPLC